MRPIHKNAGIKVGSVLYHSAFGFAAIEQINGQTATLRWEKTTAWLPTQINFEQLERVYSLCLSNGFFHRAMSDPASLRTTLHVEPLHAVTLLLQDLDSAQTKEDLRDWLVETKLISSKFFEEWWADMLLVAKSCTWLRWDQETLSLSTAKQAAPALEADFPRTLTPGARLNLALAKRDRIEPTQYLLQVCTAWTAGSTQVQNLAFQATANLDPSLVLDQLLAVDDSTFRGVIHCIRQSSWVPAQLDQATLTKLMRCSTRRLSPESPLNAEARLAAALLRWGHPTIEENLARNIQSPDGQRLLYSLFSTLPLQRSLDLIRSFFGRSMREGKLPEARWCAREWSLRATLPMSTLAHSEEDPQFANWLQEIDSRQPEPSAAHQSEPKNPEKGFEDGHISDDSEILIVAIALARSLAAHHQQGEHPVVDSEHIRISPSWEVRFLALNNEGHSGSAQDDIYLAGSFLIELILGRKLPTHLPPRVFIPYLRQIRPQLTTRLLGPLSQAVAQEPELRPEDAQSWLMALEEVAALEKTPASPSLRPKLSYDSHIGHKKLQHSQINQDSLFAQVHENFALAIVCDGVSRAEIGTGDKASRIATRTVSELWTHSVHSLISAPWPEVTNFLQRAIATANIAVTNATVQQLQGARSDRVPMASTIVAAICRGNRVSLSWLGDSRAYIVGPNGACLLTADHQTAAHQIADWRLDDDGELPGLATSLSRYLGSNLEFTSPMTLDVQSLDCCLASEERLVLCSDGVSGYLADEDAAAERILADVCNRSRLEFCASELIYLANRAGGWDNASCVVLSAT
jgi:serine/threonine protein phosphatase PrpC